VINTQHQIFFQEVGRGGAMVAMWWPRAKSHTRCVLRGRVVIPSCPHGEDHA
jgi:hypothetical protein